MEKTCNSLSKYLSDYIDGEAPSDVSWKIDMHLATCDDCSKIVRQLRSAKTLLAQVAPRPLSSDFDLKLAAKIAALDQSKIGSVSAPRNSFWDRILGGVATTRRDLKLRIGLAAAAVSMIFLGAFAPHMLVQSTGTSPYPASVTPATLSSVDSQDAEFIAACANDQAQGADNQALIDPAAQNLAARFDAATVVGDQPVSAASPRQD